jgi:glutaconate CoA-transferase subunit B
MTSHTADEMMTVAAARSLRDGVVCFVGIGIPSTAANLARAVHAPNCVLVYESGCIGSKPSTLPLSIGDNELADTADAIVSVPEIFNYWLQAGRIDVGFLGAAQVDRFGNINTTVIGSYHAPRTRLPGAGGAPEIASGAKETVIIVRQSRRTFVERVDFVTSAGFLDGVTTREELGLRGAGPCQVITDLGILAPDGRTKELSLVAVHPGVAIEDVVAATGWPLAVSPEVRVTDPPTEYELVVLRSLTGRPVSTPSGLP